MNLRRRAAATLVLAGLGLSVNVIRLQSEVALLEGRWEQARPRQARAGAICQKAMLLYPSQYTGLSVRGGNAGAMSTEP